MFVLCIRLVAQAFLPPIPPSVLVAPQIPTEYKAPLPPKNFVASEKLIPPPSAHQPFKQSFSQLKEVKYDREATESVAPAQTFTPTDTTKPKFNSNNKPKPATQETTPLASLKSQPKRDKGPTEANLSSLKAALDSVMAAGVSSQKAQTPLPTTTAVPPVFQEKPAVPVEKNTPPPPPLLETIKSPVVLHEIPEDVLRGVLAD